MNQPARAPYDVPIDPATLWRFLESGMEAWGPWEADGEAWIRRPDPRDEVSDPVTIMKIHITAGYFCPKGCERGGDGDYCQRCAGPMEHNPQARPWTTRGPPSDRVFADTPEQAMALADARLLESPWTILVPQRTP